MNAPCDIYIRNGSDVCENSPQLPELLEVPAAIYDVYLLRTGDHPGISLVSLHLNSNNYLGSSDDILNNLITKGKRGFITGNLPKPNPIFADYKLWIKNDAMIKAWIKNSIFPEQQRVFSFASTSEALWDSINDKYGQKNWVFLSKLKRTLTH